MGLINNLAQVFGPSPVRDDISRRLVYRRGDANGIEDTWERRIIELSDGRTIGDIQEILYREELSAGAWVVDIGLWKDLFYQSVARTIGQLADQGCVRLALVGTSKER